MSKHNPQDAVADLLLWSNPEIKAILDKIAQENGVNLDALAILLHWQDERQKFDRNIDKNRIFDEVFSNSKYWDNGV